MNLSQYMLLKLPLGYNIEVFAQDLDTPISMIITDKGEMLVADSGVISLEVVEFYGGRFLCHNRCG